MMVIILQDWNPPPRVVVHPIFWTPLLLDVLTMHQSRDAYFLAHDMWKNELRHFPSPFSALLWLASEGIALLSNGTVTCEL